MSDDELVEQLACHIADHSHMIANEQAYAVVAFFRSNPDALAALIGDRPVEERLQMAVGPDWQRVCATIAELLEVQFYVERGLSRSIATDIMLAICPVDRATGDETAPTHDHGDET